MGSAASSCGGWRDGEGRGCCLVEHRRGACRGASGGVRWSARPCGAESRCVPCAHVRMRAQVKSLPIHKDDEVQIVRGKFAKEQGGKVTTVYRRRFCVHIDRIVKEKANGAQVPPLSPSLPPTLCRQTARCREELARFITTVHQFGPLSEEDSRPDGGGL